MFTIQRASYYYVGLVIVPIMLLTILSFGVFFMSFEVRAILRLVGLEEGLPHKLRHGYTM